MNKIFVSNESEDIHFENATKDLEFFKKLTILVVDDDENMRFFISEVFEIYGTKVMTAANALEAIELIEKFKLDLLISDINMPEKTGYWLIEQVRTTTSRQNREIPAIALTGNSEANTQKKAIASGFHTCLFKPSSIEQLVTETTKLLKSTVLKMESGV